MTRYDTIVVGAGVFGTWTARRLQERGQRVLLIDAFGPAHGRSSSGDESRLIRASYGADEIYTRMSIESLPEWQAISERAELPLFHAAGILFFFPSMQPYLAQTLEVHGRLGLPTELLDRAALARRYPQVAWDGVELGLFEPQYGPLMARRAVQTLVAEFVRAGGDYAVAAVEGPVDGAEPAQTTTASAAAWAAATTARSTAEARRLDHVRTSALGSISAERYVFACGVWLPKLFPAELRGRIFPTRQEVFYLAPPPGDARFGPAALPAWADFNDGDMFYGIPDLEARGFKIAHDEHGPPIDVDRGDRVFSAGELAAVRAYLARRFPALASAPLVESRVCQYENSSNGDLLIDRHPSLENVWCVGAGSGHGFKHGPAVGRLAADLVLADAATSEPRFSFATKAQAQQREIH